MILDGRTVHERKVLEMHRPYRSAVSVNCQRRICRNKTSGEFRVSPNRKAPIPRNLAGAWCLPITAVSCCLATRPFSGHDEAAQGSRIRLIVREGIHFEFRFVNVECDGGFLRIVAHDMRGLVGNFQESVALQAYLRSPFSNKGTGGLELIRGIFHLHVADPPSRCYR